MGNQKLTETAGISNEVRTWTKIIKSVIDQYNKDNYVEPKGLDFYFNKFKNKVKPQTKKLTVKEFKNISQKQLDIIIEKLMTYYGFEYDEVLELPDNLIVIYYNNIEDDPDYRLFENEQKQYTVDRDKIIINGKDFPDAYENFSVDKWIISPNINGEYDHINSGYNENGEYYIYLNIPINQVSEYVLNHEIKHAYQDWNRIKSGKTPISQTRELRQFYTKDFERYLLSNPVHNKLNTINGLIKGYYLTSTPEITAYLEGEYDRIIDKKHTFGMDYYRIAQELSKLKVEDIEKDVTPEKLQSQWDEIITKYNIPFFQKFKNVNDFIKYSVKFLSKRGEKIMKKINKMKYIHGLEK